MTSLRSRAFHSLFWRLMLAFGSVVVAALLLSTLVLNRIFESAFERQVAEVMLEDARGVSLWAESYIASAKAPEAVQRNLPWLHAVTEGRMWLVNADGIVVADTGTQNNYRGMQLRHPWVARVLDGGVLKETEADPWLDAAITVGYPVEKDGQVTGAVFLFMAPTRLWKVMGEYRLPIGLSVFGLMMTGLIAAYSLSRSFARPVEMMSRFAADLGEKRFAGDLPPSNVKELEGLGYALRGAARQLDAAFGAVVEEKQRIQSLIQEMAEGVVAVDERGRITLVNPAAGRMLGAPGPFDGVRVGEAGFPPELVEALRQAADPAATAHGRVDFACGGAEIHANVSPIGLIGQQASGAVAVLQDLTTAAQFRRLRENFVANVSHELRGPLASLSAAVEAMHDGVIPEERRPRYLALMVAEIARLRRLVDDLLELSRLDAGMVQIPQEEFDLKPLCEGMGEKWEPRCNAGGISLSVESPHLRVVANYDRVEEILTNLIDNAVRFTPPGGSIAIFARPEGEMVRVGVTDTGIGISKKHLPHIWDRFYKADPARTRGRSGGGTGLGLALVKQLTELLGGEVAVTSEPDRGSTFSVTLVAAPQGGRGLSEADRGGT